MKPQLLKIGLLTVVAVAALPALYYLSLGPVGWLCARGVLPSEPFEALYRKLIWADTCGASRYYEWWVPQDQIMCGGMLFEISSSTNTAMNAVVADDDYGGDWTNWLSSPPPMDPRGAMGR